MKLVSAIMPTRGRQELAARALKCFLEQEYGTRQLIIVDDVNDRSFPEGLSGLGPSIVYTMHPSRNIAEKRNIAIGHAQGEIICHFDSDDWSDPGRISDQVARLDESGKAVTAYHSMFFCDVDRMRAYLYRGNRSDAIGTSLMFRRDWWKAHPFRVPTRQANVGEDTLFSRDASGADELTTTEAGWLMVARIHADNTSPKIIGPTSTSYQSVTMERLPQGFFA